VGSFVVVGLPEAVELFLEFRNALGRGLLGEPFLECLVEALDLALGLGVTRAAVLLGDAQEREEVLEGVASATESGGVDAAVVGQGRGGEAVFLGDVEEAGGDDVGGDGGVGGAAE
jgi:hypothetical protein